METLPPRTARRRPQSLHGHASGQYRERTNSDPRLVMQTSPHKDPFTVHQRGSCRRVHNSEEPPLVSSSPVPPPRSAVSLSSTDLDKTNGVGPMNHPVSTQKATLDTPAHRMTRSASYGHQPRSHSREEPRHEPVVHRQPHHSAGNVIVSSRMTRSISMSSGPSSRLSGQDMNRYGTMPAAVDTRPPYGSGDSDLLDEADPGAYLDFQPDADKMSSTGSINRKPSSTSSGCSSSPRMLNRDGSYPGLVAPRPEPRQHHLSSIDSGVVDAPWHQGHSQRLATGSGSSQPLPDTKLSQNLDEEDEDCEDAFDLAPNAVFSPRPGNKPVPSTATRQTFENGGRPHYRPLDSDPSSGSTRNPAYVSARGITMDNSERRGLARPVTAGVILQDSSTQISRDSKYSNPKEWANECLQDFDDEEKEEEAEEVKEALGAEWHEEGRGHTSPAWDDGRPSLLHDEDSGQSPREHLILEFIRSEEEYAHDLQRCVNEYLEPLESTEFVMTEILFGNIENLLEVAQTLLRQLRRSTQHGTGEDWCIGNCFTDMHRNLAIAYQMYCSNYSEACKLLCELHFNPDFHDALLRLNDEQSDDGRRQQHQHQRSARDLRRSLALPTLHLLMYPMKLQELYEFTPKTHPDRRVLREAIVFLEDMSFVITSIKRRKALRDGDDVGVDSVCSKEFERVLDNYVASLSSPPTDKTPAGSQRSSTIGRQASQHAFSSPQRGLSDVREERLKGMENDVPPPTAPRITGGDRFPPLPVRQERPMFADDGVEEVEPEMHEDPSAWFN
ncbi:uncharacterized protein LOC135822898 isoform X2 [Sycon ciliatum]|uniref:uncharacterized protein LOC135822898 isoform X2 n=1 Tax=Sycon ciliatum TaxID=27933 RepID=UPI0031F6D2A0